MQTFYNLFFMFGGVAAMMFGMKIMGGGLEKFAGGKMKKMLGRFTTNRFAGIGVGLAVTTIIQSSTATTVMLVGFVNIGLMSLMQATHVIMGANIGTTITAHIVSLSGSGAIDIGAIAAMIGCVGVLMGMLIKNEKIATIGNILGGLGLLFVGLEVISTYAKLVMLKDGEPVEFVKAIFIKEHFPLLLVLIGIIITALVHSSSTITSLLVILASLDIISFSNALFLALGSNIGTCITSILSSAGTNINAKRTAMVHFMFNFFGCVIFIAPIWIWSSEITVFFAGISSNVGRQIAIFHTAFNVLTTLFLLPFTKIIINLVCKLVPEKAHQEKVEFTLKNIDNKLLEVPPLAVSITKEEIVRMAGIARTNLNLAMEFLLNDEMSEPTEFKRNEQELNFLNKTISNFLTKLIGKDLSELDDKKVGSYYHVVSDIERIGDYAENIIEYSLKLREEGLSFSPDAKLELQNFVSAVNDLFAHAIATFSDRNYSLIGEVEVLEEKIDDLAVEFENNHIERLKKGQCTSWLGSVYLKTLSHLERIGDHITNVATSIKLYKNK